MSLSQQVGAAVALKALGYRVKLQSPGMVIEAVDPDGPSAGKLRAQDIVVSVDGRPTPSRGRAAPGRPPSRAGRSRCE